MKFKKPKFWDDKSLSFWSILLLPISIIYLIITTINKKFKNPKKFTIPIICVGNIYLGGTGKTPLVRKVFSIKFSKILSIFFYVFYCYTHVFIPLRKIILC